MNNLSLAIWAVDSLTGLSGLLHIGIICSIAWLIGIILHCAWEDSLQALKKLYKGPLIAFFIFSVLTTILPSKQAAYLIMGSEMGEEVINSEIGKQTLDILKYKLDEVKKEMLNGKK